MPRPEYPRLAGRKSFCDILGAETGLRKWIIQVTNSAHRVSKWSGSGEPVPKKREPAPGRFWSAPRRLSRRGGKANLGRPATGSQLLEPAPAGYEKPPNRLILPALGVDREKWYGFGVTVTRPVGGVAQRKPGVLAGEIPVAKIKSKPCAINLYTRNIIKY